MFSSITMMRTAVWLGLVNSMCLPPPPLFVSSSTSCNLLQISGLIHSNTHFHHLVLFRVTPRVPIQQRLVITIATTACDALRALRNKALALKKKITHTLICYMKFYFMVFMKGIAPPTKPTYLLLWTRSSLLLRSFPTPTAL